MTQILAPDALISQVTTALDELREQVRGVDFQNYPKASSLPGWSTAQLIAHLASFAKAARRQFERAGQEPPLEMYDGGAAGRIEAINMTALMRPEALLELTNTALAELREVLPSAANFIFARHQGQDAATLAAGLREQGVIVRHFKQPRIAQFLRITVGTPEQNQALVEALRGMCG